MGQVLGADRNGGLTFVSGSAVQMNLSTLSDIKATIGGQQYQVTSALLVNTGSTGVGGLDTGALGAYQIWYVHYVLSGSTIALVASLSKTAPTGFTPFLWTGFAFITNSSSQVGFVANSTTWDWHSFTMVPGATVTAPTKGTTVQDNAQWRRVGGALEMSWDYGQNGAGSAGSGTYLLPLPFAMDTTKINVCGATAETICGSGVFAQPYAAAPSSNSGTNNVPLAVIAFNSTNLAVLPQDVQTASTFILLGYNKVLWNSSFTNFSTSNMGLSIRASVPIVGWSANAL